MRRLSRVLSKGFIRIMILLGMFGLGLWLLGQIISIAGRNGATAPVGAVAARYRAFATTGH